MRIAYFVWTWGEVTQTFVYSLASGLARSGSTVRVFADEIRPGLPRPDGLSIVRTPFLTGWPLTRRALVRLGRVMRRPGISDGFARLAAERAVSGELRDFAPDVAHIEFGPIAAALCPLLVARSIPFVVHFHGYDATELLGAARYREAIAPVFREAARVIVPSHHLRRRLVLAGCGPARIRVVPYGIAPERFARFDWSARRAFTPRVLAVGRLVEKKDPIATLHALRLVRERVPAAQLTLVGEGPLRGAVEETVRLLGLAGSVSLCGEVPNDDVLPLFGTHHVFAQHSVTSSQGDQEGLPVAILEAAAAGLPVVSTRHSGIPESVVDGQTGWLVPEHDYEAMADRIAGLLLDLDAAERMGLAGKHRIGEYFTLSARVARIQSELTEASAGTPAEPPSLPSRREATS